jgi:hypothetical protein
MAVDGPWMFELLSTSGVAHLRCCHKTKNQQADKPMAVLLTLSLCAELYF